MMRKRALIYNNYLETLGGGERSTLDLARALEELGLEVSLACAQKCTVTADQLAGSFGIPAASTWAIHEFESEDELGLFAADFDLFANHTSCSFMPNKTRFGMYMAMFPLDYGPAISAQLATYHVICCNSPFTRNYAVRRWGKDLNIIVLPPPISEVHTIRPPVFEEKQPVILNVGRFNVFGHNKRQLEAIEAFGTLRGEGIIDDSWRLVVCGYVNESPQTLRYVEQCRQAADISGGVLIETNADFEKLQQHYRSAAAVWQFTGIGLPFGEDPGSCEHLGLAALDGFAYGAVPIVYQRGGMIYFIKQGFNGYCFADIFELSTIMRFFNHILGTEVHRKIFDYTRESVKYFTFDSFKNRIAKLLNAAGVI